MNNTNNTNVLPELKNPSVFYPFAGLIIFLIIVLFCLLFKVPNVFNSKFSKSDQEITANILICVSFSLLFVGICVLFLPNFKQIRSLFEQISNVSYAIIYTIFLILFFTMMPGNIINNYAFLITPITMLLGGIIFYKSAIYNYVDKFNVNYERIKSMILFFCLISIFIMYYAVDPGGYINKYFGYSLLLTIIIAVFAFLYLIIVLTLPEKVEGTNLLENFTEISSYGSIGFLLFIVIITIIISTYPGGFFADQTNAAASMIILLIICILWAVILAGTQFPELTNNISINDKFNLFKRSLLALFGIVISSLIIFWIVYNIQNLSGKSNITSFVLNIFLVIIVLGLIYKTINVQLPAGNANKNAFFSLIMSVVFYIPCLFSGGFDSIGKFTVGQYNSTSMGSIIMLVLSIILLIAYLKTPSLFNAINVQGGKQLVNKPVYTDKQYSLGTYQDLNGNDNFDYQYAISCWIFIDAAPPNMNSSYNKFTSLLNFGEKPNILYNGKTNTLMITTDQKDLDKHTKNKLIDFDQNNNRIIYKNENVLLQKWNNIIINYNGGVLDIFLNGELVKSDIGVVPYYKLDNLTIGQDTGIKGGICNVVYFNHPLTSSNIYYLYNMAKNSSPPVLNNSDETIIVKL
jgi:hypothetical protein